VISLIKGKRVVPGPSSTVPGVTMPRWEILPVQVFDGGAGVAAETIKVQISGQPLIAEPDLIRDQILVELPDGLDPGAHSLAIEAADEVGNTCKTVLEIDLAESKP
jgi:hypothetical protein